MSIILNLFVSKYISLNFFKFFEIYNTIFYKNSRVVIPMYRYRCAFVPRCGAAVRE